jgi:hypothetical protein
MQNSSEIQQKRQLKIIYSIKINKETKYHINIYLFFIHILNIYRLKLFINITTTTKS